MSIKHEIETHIEDPIALEKIYRKSPEVFANHFDEVYHAYPYSPVLETWHARLQYDKPATARSTQTFIHRPSEILFVILLCLASGTLAKLPFWTGIDEDFFFPRNIGFLVLPALACYFWVRNAVPRVHIAGLSLVFLGAAIFINMLPAENSSDTLALACIHLPLFLWVLTGMAYTGTAYRDVGLRLGYLKFNGELAIYTALILIAGGLLTALTIGLFEAIGLDIGEWYAENIIVYGIASAPIVATYITIHRANVGQRIAPTIAKIFSPLVLITLVAFLVANLAQGKSPFTDRDFLIVFNAMLMGVLAITIFTISERPTVESRIPSDYIALALVVVALVVDVVALSAIVFRLTSYGLTPNRLAVLGANLLVFGHLAGILYHYSSFLRSRIDMLAVESWIARYLPLYTAWTAFIVFVLPFLFNFA